MEKTQEKAVIPLAKALEVGAQTPTGQQQANKTKPVWKFKKIRFPAAKVKLGDKRLEFRLVKDQSGSYTGVALFDTEDENLAKQLMELAKSPDSQDVVFLKKQYI